MTTPAPATSATPSFTSNLTTTTPGPTQSVAPIATRPASPMTTEGRTGDRSAAAVARPEAVTSTDLGIQGYADLTEVDRGGFATAYCAGQPTLEREVAIKVGGLKGSTQRLGESVTIES